MFAVLKLEDIHKIVDIQMGLIDKRLKERRMSVELTEKAKSFIAEQGYSPVYGARPLKRSLQKLILDPLAMEILAGKFVEGDHIVIDQSPEGEMSLTKK
jgi:ATP-dependent Clp protease ATP-binding subunit ClpB